jgi:pimeloyl-ACP methyl ester carboxylesterase
MSTGFFWITGDSAGPMYVEWSSPAEPTAPCPVVLVHGGGGQGTDWLGTPDGRPGWAPLLVERGWPVYVVDRPGHGRAAGFRDTRGPAPTLEITASIFASGAVPGHTQWPGPGGPGDPAIAQLAASSTGLSPDAAAAQSRDGARLVELLERIGPAVVVTHSLGAPAGWLAADARPDLVRAVVALEPPGPPYLHAPEMGLSLDWGLTTAPLTFDPPVASPEYLQQAGHTLPSVAGLPVAVVEAEASPLGGGAGPVAQFLTDMGAASEHIRLANHGVHGNGHGMILERNNHEVLDVVLRWLDTISLA